MNGANALGLNVSVRDDTGEPVAVGHFAGMQFVHANITITKPLQQTTFYFLTLRGLRTLLADDALSSVARRVLTAEQTYAFAAESCVFEPWTVIVPDVQEPDALESIDPRRFVRDLAQGRVPRTVGDALLAAAPSVSGSAPFTDWRENAVRRLRAALANEIAMSGTAEIVTLQGARTINVEVEAVSTMTSGLFEAANDAGHWVYASGPDVDTRHVMFTHELAREWHEGRSWYDGFPTFAPRALASAKNVYRKHLAKTSNETLTALEGLRKALNEEIVKVTQQTRDLGAGLWRDFAVVLTTLVARVALVVAGNRAADTAPVVYTTYGVAAYIAVTLVVALYANARFGAIASSNRATWRRSLYGFLTDEDFRTLAEEPLQDANGVYRTTAWVVSVGYAAMVAALILTTVFVHVGSAQIGTGKHAATTRNFAMGKAAVSPKTKTAPGAKRARHS